MLADDRIRGKNPDAPHNVILEGRSRMSIIIISPNGF